MNNPIVKAVVLFIVILLVVPATVLGWVYTIAPWMGIVEMRETVQSGEFRMYSYEYFYNQIVAIKEAEQAYISQNDKLLKQEPGSDEYNRTLTNIAAIETNIVKLKTQYNEYVQMEGTRGQFKDNNLPDYIPPTLPIIP